MKSWTRIAPGFLLLTACFLTTVLSSEPKLKILPQSAFFDVKKQSFLMCSGSSANSDDSAFTEITWYDPNGQNLNNHQGKFDVKRIGNSLKLSFENPTMEDSGYYNCTATYQNTDRLQAQKLVTFYEEITWEDCAVEQSLVLGQRGFVSCKPIGTPKPIISWEKDGEPVDQQRLVVRAEGVEISEVHSEDAGTYSVFASVLETGKEDVRHITTSVHVPPKITKLGKEFPAIEGNDYSIDCLAEGFPRPLITWFDPGQRNLNNLEGYTVSDEGRLTIHAVTQSSKGTYTCLAKNAAGEDQQSTELYVLVKPVITKFDNITAIDSRSTILQCEARGDPDPELTIRRDNSPEPFSENQGNELILESSKDVTNGVMVLRLEIRHVSRNDDGLYYCAAKNDAGRVERVGHINVRFLPDLSGTTRTKAFAWPRHPGNLTCVVVANPNATITWKFRNEEILSNSDTYSIIHGNGFSTLMVDVGDSNYDRDVFGTYTCIARNEEGDMMKNITLSQGREPGALSQIIFSKITPTSITFDFMGIQQSDEDNVPVTSIVVEYWVGKYEEAALKKHEWAVGSTYILDDLKPRTKYHFKIAPKNDVGTGHFLSSQCEMPQGEAPNSPEFITKNETLSESANAFKFKWTIPNDNGEPILNFQIRYFKVMRNRVTEPYKQVGTDTNIVVTNWENPIYELTGLSPSTTYKIELRAVNKIGQSFLKNGLIFTTRAGGSSDSQTEENRKDPLPLHVVIAIAVVAVLLLLVLLDITSYLRFHCGLLYLMRYHNCGGSQAEKVKDVGLEDGKACAGRKHITNGSERKYRDDPFEDTPMM